MGRVMKYCSGGVWRRGEERRGEWGEWGEWVLEGGWKRRSDGGGIRLVS